MQYKFGKEEETFRQELRRLPQEAELPRKWRYGLIETADEDSEVARAMRLKLADRGWLTMGWPKEYGGQDASPITQLVFNEEMAYYRAPGKGRLRHRDARACADDARDGGAEAQVPPGHR